MSPLLSIDTAGTACSAAVSDSGEILSISVVDEPRVHATRLVPTIRELISDAGLSMSDLAAVAVSKGPGSFTGLRIGVSTAKGLCYGLGIPLIGVPTLEAMAFANRLDLDFSVSRLLTVAPSRRGEAYWQVWDVASQNPMPLAEARSDMFETIVSEFLEASPVRFVIVGEIPDLLLRGFESARADFFVVSSDSRRPTIEGIVALGSASFGRSDFEDVATFEPHYLKEFVAKKGGSPFDRLP